MCCVNGLKWNWENEVKIHSKEKAHILGCYENSKGNLVIGSVQKRKEDLLKKHDEYFLITNIETIRDKEIGKILKQMCISGDIGMVIIDEIHKCKNPTSKQGKSIHNLCNLNVYPKKTRRQAIKSLFDITLIVIPYKLKK